MNLFTVFVTLICFHVCDFRTLDMESRSFYSYSDWVRAVDTFFLEDTRRAGENIEQPVIHPYETDSDIEYIQREDPWGFATKIYVSATETLETPFSRVRGITDSRKRETMDEEIQKKFLNRKKKYVSLTHEESGANFTLKFDVSYHKGTIPVSDQTQLQITCYEDYVTIQSRDLDFLKKIVPGTRLIVNSKSPGCVHEYNHVWVLWRELIAESISFTVVRYKIKPLSFAEIFPASTIDFAFFPGDISEDSQNLGRRISFSGSADVVSMRWNQDEFGQINSAEKLLINERVPGYDNFTVLCRDCFFNIRAGVFLNVRTSWFYITHFSFGFYGEAGLAFNTRANWTGALSNPSRSVPILDPENNYIRLFLPVLGFIPVDIHYGIEIQLNYTIQAQLTWAHDMSMTMKKSNFAYFEWDGGSTETFKSDKLSTEIHIGSPTVDARASGELTLGVNLILEPRFLEFSCRIGLYPYVTATFQLENSKMNIPISYGLDLSFFVDCRAKIFGYGCNTLFEMPWAPNPIHIIANTPLGCVGNDCLGSSSILIAEEGNMVTDGCNPMRGTFYNCLTEIFDPSSNSNYLPVGQMVQQTSLEFGDEYWIYSQTTTHQYYLLTIICGGSCSVRWGTYYLFGFSEMGSKDMGEEVFEIPLDLTDTGYYLTVVVEYRNMDSWFQVEMLELRTFDEASVLTSIPQSLTKDKGIAFRFKDVHFRENVVISVEKFNSVARILFLTTYMVNDHSTLVCTQKKPNFISMSNKNREEYVVSTDGLFNATQTTQPCSEVFTYITNDIEIIVRVYPNATTSLNLMLSGYDTLQDGIREYISVEGNGQRSFWLSLEGYIFTTLFEIQFSGSMNGGKLFANSFTVPFSEQVVDLNGFTVPFFVDAEDILSLGFSFSPGHSDLILLMSSAQNVLSGLQVSVSFSDLFPKTHHFRYDLAQKENIQYFTFYLGFDLTGTCFLDFYFMISDGGSGLSSIEDIFRKDVANLNTLQIQIPNIEYSGNPIIVFSVGSSDGESICDCQGTMAAYGMYDIEVGQNRGLVLNDFETLYIRSNPGTNYCKYTFSGELTHLLFLMNDAIKENDLGVFTHDDILVGFGDFPEFVISAFQDRILGIRNSGNGSVSLTFDFSGLSSVYTCDVDVEFSDAAVDQYNFVSVKQGGFNITLKLSSLCEEGFQFSMKLLSGNILQEFVTNMFSSGGVWWGQLTTCYFNKFNDLRNQSDYSTLFREVFRQDRHELLLMFSPCPAMVRTPGVSEEITLSTSTLLMQGVEKLLASQDNLARISGSSYMIQTAMTCPGDCNGHGTCNVGSCTCDWDWYGDDCSLPKCNGRNEDGCWNGGICLEDHTCQCDSYYWFGPECEISKCNGLENGCLNGGTCGLDHICYCDSEWFGADCSLPKCNGLDFGCQNGGICQLDHTCLCDDQWEGNACEIPRCNAGVGCLNEGICTQSHVCICVGQWYGESCILPKCNEKVEGCQNGECKLDHTCDCGDMFTGNECQIPLCNGHVDGCQNGGFCDDDHNCVCPSKYYGDTCENRVCNDILMSPTPKNTDNGCNNGECLEDFTCKCPRGWKGVDCSEIVPAKSSSSSGWVVGIVFLGLGVFAILIVVSIIAVVLFVGFRFWSREKKTRDRNIELGDLEETCKDSSNSDSSGHDSSTGDSSNEELTKDRIVDNTSPKIEEEEEEERLKREKKKRKAERAKKREEKRRMLLKKKEKEDAAQKKKDESERLKQEEEELEDRFKKEDEDTLKKEDEEKKAKEEAEKLIEEKIQRKEERAKKREEKRRVLLKKKEKEDAVQKKKDEAERLKQDEKKAKEEEEDRLKKEDEDRLKKEEKKAKEEAEKLFEEKIQRKEERAKKREEKRRVLLKKKEKANAAQKKKDEAERLKQDEKKASHE